MASDKMLGSFDQKSAPEDNDLLVEYDAAASKVKNVKFGGVWNWIVKKLTSAVINELQTSSKNVVGAINELNSNSVKSKNNPSDLNSLISNGVYACGDISSIKNLPSSMTTSGILIVFSNQPYIGQIIFSHVFFYTRFSTTSGNEWYDWMKIK